MSFLIHKFKNNNTSKDYLYKLSVLFFQASPEYDILYKKFRFDKFKFFKELFKNKNSEIKELLIVEKNKKPIGFINGFASDQLKLRKIQSILIFKNLIYPKNPSNFIKKKIKNLGEIDKSYYISKLSIEKKFRKKGLANKLLNKIYAKSKKNKFRFLSLHVQKSNKIAIKFYLRNNFFVSNSKYSYLYMKRKI